MSSETNPLTRAISLVAHAIGRDASLISAQDELGSIPEWDSLAHIAIIEGVESYLGERLPDDAVEKLTTVNAIATFLAERDKSNAN
jgi:acyl carrier protein